LSFVKIIVSAISVFLLGLIAYRIQKKYEEIRDFFLRDGLEYLHQEISFYFSAFQNNYEILMGLLKNIRDYDPAVTFKINFDDIKIKLVDYYPKGFAFRAIHNVEYLVSDDIITKRTYNLFSHISAARMSFNEIYIAIKMMINNPDKFLVDEKSREKHFEDLYKDIEKKRELIYENLFILDITAEILNRIRDKHHFYITLSGLKKTINKDSKIQKLLHMALWNPLLMGMKKGGVPVTAFLGFFKPDKEYQEKRIQRWEKFKKLIKNNYVEPCTYKESTSPPQIQREAEKWKEFLDKKDNESYSGAYKLSKTDDSDIENIKGILIKEYLSQIKAS